MKQTYTKAPVIPRGYERLNYNLWMAYVTKTVNKITGTTPDQRLIKS